MTHLRTAMNLKIISNVFQIMLLIILFMLLIISTRTDIVFRAMD